MNKKVEEIAVKYFDKMVRLLVDHCVDLKSDIGMDSAEAKAVNAYIKAKSKTVITLSPIQLTQAEADMLVDELHQSNCSDKIRKIVETAVNKPSLTVTASAATKKTKAKKIKAVPQATAPAPALTPDPNKVHGLFK